MWTSRLPLTLLACAVLVGSCAAKFPTHKPPGARAECRIAERRCPGEGTSCDNPGCGPRTDICLARRQARLGEDGQWIIRHYSFDRFLGLNRTSTPRSVPRTRLDEALLKRIDRIETSAGAALDGYLIAVRQAKSDRGSCRNGGRRALEVWVGPSPGAPRSEAIRARLTPGVLKEHPIWTLSRLRHWRSRGHDDAPRVRIRGYLLYNNLKGGEVEAGLRPTAWEVSPVTEILFCPSTWKCGSADREGWLELDTL